MKDRFGRCVVCGRREECCELCHRGHDYAWEHPMWSVAGGYGVDQSGDRIVPAKRLSDGWLR